MLGTIRRLLGLGVQKTPKETPREPRFIRARYDSAQTTADNRRHWAAADHLSAAAANSPSIRKTLRSRARYEFANNSYANGIVKTLANDRIGRGPRLQVYSPDEAANEEFETAFAVWAREIGLASKLRTMSQSYDVDGEAIAQFKTNPKLPTRVKLDIALVECDRLSNPPTKAMTVEGQMHDGIEFDADGNETHYHIADKHPGDPNYSSAKWNRIPADQVIHWFRVDRPGQTRGVPTLTPALDLFGELRRYTQAVIGAAETAADFAGILETTSPTAEVADVELFAEMPIERRMLTAAPEGWKLAQMKAEQPTSTYGDFKREVINEVARCLNVPYNVAAGNSSSYNYSSGRLDHQVYHRSIGIDRNSLEYVGLKKILNAFVAEYRLLGGRVPPGDIVDWLVAWLWPGFSHVDPTKEATAQGTRLANLTSSLEQEWADEGEDFWRVLPRIARQHKALIDAGLPSPFGPKLSAAPAAPTPKPDSEDPPDEEDDDADGKPKKKT